MNTPVIAEVRIFTVPESGAAFIARMQAIGKTIAGDGGIENVVVIHPGPLFGLTRWLGIPTGTHVEAVSCLLRPGYEFLWEVPEQRWFLKNLIRSLLKSGKGVVLLIPPSYERRVSQLVLPFLY